MTRKLCRRLPTPIVLLDRFYAIENEVKMFEKEGLLFNISYSSNYMRHKCPHEIKQNAEEIAVSAAGYFMQQERGSLKCKVSYVYKGTLGGMVPLAIAEKLFKNECQRARTDHQKDFPSPIKSDNLDSV